MALYSMGKPAAIAAIKAAVAFRTSVLTDGSRLLDVASLKQWLAQQGNDIITNDVLPVNLEAAQGALSTIDANPDCDSLAAFIVRANWESRPDWPTRLPLSQGQGLVSSVYKTLVDMENAVKEIQRCYEGVFGQIEAIVNKSAEEMGLDAKLPPTTERFVEARYIIYTYVTDRGEESAPSPVSDAVLCDQNDKARIVIAPEPLDRYITKWRSYRTNVGTQGAEFQLEGEYPIATRTIDVEKPSSDLGEICPTFLWEQPPDKLRGLVNLTNGIMAGFIDNTVCFCEPFVPYAWPVSYQMTVPHPIVALSTFGQTLVVMHQGGVDYISGSDAASMSIQKDVSKQACVSPRSVALVEGGVMYASPDGLCLASGQGVDLITKNSLMRQEWQDIAPSSIIGGYAEQTYFGGWNKGANNGVFMLHLPTMKITTIDLTGSAVFSDTKTDTLYLAQGTNVVALFNGVGRRMGTWRSKVAVLPKHAGFAWLTVESEFEFPVTVNWYVDGALFYTTVPPITSRTPVRLPAVRGLEHEIEVVTQARWNSLTMASSTQELQAV